MERLKVHKDPRVSDKFKSYPDKIRPKINMLRSLILEAATELEQVSEIEETLKWGEPSYLTKKGSTVRIDWKSKTPDQYAIYFKCTSKLVSTFKEVYGDTFRYEKNRAILFGLGDDVPQKELKKCISAALQYHNVKLLADLGMR